MLQVFLPGEQLSVLSLVVLAYFKRVFIFYFSCESWGEEVIKVFVFVLEFYICGDGNLFL